MKRRAVRLALATAIGLITLSLLAGAAAGHSGGSNGAPKSLTHHFPLGTQTLSHTRSAPAHGPATTPAPTLGDDPARRVGHGVASTQDSTDSAQVRCARRRLPPVSAGASRVDRRGAAEPAGDP
jgi:hypothetical protein